MLMRDARARMTAPARRRGSAKLRGQEALWGYSFILPAVVGFVVFVAGPLVAVFLSSLQHYNSLSGRASFAGFENYQTLATNGTFAIVLGNTAIFSLAVIPANIILGISLAVLINRQIPAIGFFRTVYFVPAVISLVAWSLVWEHLLQDRGGLNSLLQSVGIDGPNWLADPQWSMVAVVAVQVLRGVGVSMVLFLAALQEVPAEIVEASTVDGANRWQAFTRIILPLISPTILMVSILATINSLKAFAQVFLLTKGGPGLSTTILGYYIYDQAFGAFQVGFASAAAVVLFIIVLGLTLLQWWTRKRWVFNEQ